MAFQFPVYGLFVGLGKTRKERTRYALGLLVVHVAAVIVGLLMYRGS